MINFLPPDLKDSYRYAHRNLNLLRWVILFSVGFVGLAIISGAGMMYLQRQTNAYALQNNITGATLKKQDQDKVQKEISEISGNLKLVVQVLSREILFSKLLTRLGAVTPSNAILTGISISQTTGGIDIAAKTADYHAATQLQVNLSDPANKIFSKADIVNIDCSDTTTDPQYPCVVTIRALFSDNNPFLFINAGKSAS
jgi:Tfp pilus assembly protein PilN